MEPESGDGSAARTTEPTSREPDLDWSQSDSHMSIREVEADGMMSGAVVGQKLEPGMVVDETRGWLETGPAKSQTEMNITPLTTQPFSKPGHSGVQVSMNNWI